MIDPNKHGRFNNDSDWSSMWRTIGLVVGILVMLSFFEHCDRHDKAIIKYKESCNTPTTPLPQVIEYWCMKGPIRMDMEVISVYYEYAL